MLYIVEEFAHRNGEFSPPCAIPSLPQMIQTKAATFSHFGNGTILNHLIQNTPTARQIEKIGDLHHCCCIILVHVFVLKKQMSVWISLLE